jgi:arylsulfatase A-like enzyme
MDRRSFLRKAGSAALSVPLAAHLRCRKSGRRPNILFLFADDQRYNTLGALNCPSIQTPVMDRLMKEGFTFTHAHIMGGTSGAVCMPSRAMLLTGRSLFHLENRGATVPEDHMMLPELLRQAGYTTCGIGKWHNSRPAYARCFTRGGKIMFRGMSDHSTVPVYDFDPSGAYPPEKQYTADSFSSRLFADEAIGFLDTYTEDNPFFLYIAFTAPHDPRMAPPPYDRMYRAEELSLPPNFLPDHPFDNGEMRVRDENLAPHPRTPETVREHLAAYYAMITHLDAQIGRVLETLEARGLLENTIVVFTSDNGLAVGGHGLLGKQNLYDHSVRVPLILRGPNIPSGVRSSALCYISDLFPTLCDTAGVRIPEENEALSLLPILKDPGVPSRDSLFLAYTHLQRGLRTRDGWKLIRYNLHGVQHTQLFDLNTDPWETQNLADDPARTCRLERMSGFLKNHMRTLDDFCDLDRPNWGLPVQKTAKTRVRHRAGGCRVVLDNPPSSKYHASPELLTDGIRGTSRHGDGCWAGFEGTGVEAVVHLGREIPVSRVILGCLENWAAWIFLPRRVAISLSEDGIHFGKPAVLTPDGEPEDTLPGVHDFTAFFQNRSARIIRIRADNRGTCPPNHPGAGGKAWIFMDEIVVE